MWPLTRPCLYTFFNEASVCTSQSSWIFAVLYATTWQMVSQDAHTACNKCDCTRVLPCRFHSFINERPDFLMLPHFFPTVQPGYEEKLCLDKYMLIYLTTFLTD